ncbi:MAG: hypothetical protein JST76_13955 [Bacteroidetes bacterium]|nr:hypothetical protein [Bacteroidota bacterium]
MNLNNVFSRSLMSSLGAGFLIFFIGIPLVVTAISLCDSGDVKGLEGVVFLIAMIMYIVYWPIQIALSIIHLILTRYWQRTSLPTAGGIWQAFIISEWLLYMAIYLFLVWAFYDKDIWMTIFLFSIPYIIACTVSVFYYKRNYEKELCPVTEPTSEI